MVAKALTSTPAKNSKSLRFRMKRLHFGGWSYGSHARCIKIKFEDGRTGLRSQKITLRLNIAEYFPNLRGGRHDT